MYERNTHNLQRKNTWWRKQEQEQTICRNCIEKETEINRAGRDFSKIFLRVRMGRRSIYVDLNVWCRAGHFKNFVLFRFEWVGDLSMHRLDIWHRAGHFNDFVLFRFEWAGDLYFWLTWISSVGLVILIILFYLGLNAGYPSIETWISGVGLVILLILFHLGSSSGLATHLFNLDFWCRPG